MSILPDGNAGSQVDLPSRRGKKMLEKMNEREREILNRIVMILEKHLKPGKIILFGSRAKADYYGNPDFDLAIDQEKVEIRKHRKVMEDIEAVAGLYKVDLVYLGSVDESFKDLVLKTGETVYERRS